MGLKYSGYQQVTGIGELKTVVVGEDPEGVFETFKFANT